MLKAKGLSSSQVVAFNIDNGERSKVHAALRVSLVILISSCLGEQCQDTVGGVKTGKAQREQMFSALPLRADIAQQSRHVRFVPIVLQNSQNAVGSISRK